MRAVELWAALAAVAAVLALRRALLRRRTIPGAVALLAEAIPDALGDAVLAIDAAGRIGHANSAAARLLGIAVADLVDADLADVAPELFLLARGLERGPARARIQVPAPGRRGRPRPGRGGAGRRASAVGARRPAAPPGRAALSAAAAAGTAAARGLRPRRPGATRARGSRPRRPRCAIPSSGAAEALSLLRLAAPPLSAQAAGELAAAEDALEVAARRVAALASAGQGAGARRALDLAALVEELVAGVPGPARACACASSSRPRARSRTIGRCGRRSASCSPPRPRRSRRAARSRSRSASRTAPRRSRSARPARVAPGGLSLARALVAPQGGRVEEEPVPGRGRRRADRARRRGGARARLARARTSPDRLTPGRTGR